jgi:hypothetical protein
MSTISATKCALLAAVGALSFTALPAFAQSDAAEPERDSKGRIKDKNHPDYMKCRTEPVIGSRAKKRRVCLTNREWERVARDGNNVADRLVEDMASGMTGN